jgi:hypothetical protein
MVAGQQTNVTALPVVINGFVLKPALKKPLQICRSGRK